MEADDETTVRTMESYRETVSSLIDQHNGRVIDSPGDNLLSEFGSVVDAVQCAVEVQHIIKAKNAGLPEARRMAFRIGINLGDVIEEEGRTYGDGINIAARIEKLADSGGICISGSAYEQIVSKLSLGYENLGEHAVKNIARPVQVYRIPMDSNAVAEVDKAKDAVITRWRNKAMGLIVLIAVGSISIAVWYHLRESTPPAEIIPAAKEAAPAEKMASTVSEKPSIAVLPFDNMSGDPEQEYFSDGMTEEIITKLSVNPMLMVIARNSTFFYKGKQFTIRQIGEELRARYVVEGSVRKAGNSVRITAQLIDVVTGGHLWAGNYDRELKDVFSLQDEIALQIVANLNIEYQEAELLRIERAPTEDMTAYDYLLRGWSHSRRLSKGANAEARGLYRKAIELDPGFAMAYASLGFSYLWDRWISAKCLFQFPQTRD